MQSETDLALLFIFTSCLVFASAPSAAHISKLGPVRLVRIHTYFCLPFSWLALACLLALLTYLSILTPSCEPSDWRDREIYIHTHTRTHTHTFTHAHIYLYIFPRATWALLFLVPSALRLEIDTWLLLFAGDRSGRGWRAHHWSTRKKLATVHLCHPGPPLRATQCVGNLLVRAGR